MNFPVLAFQFAFTLASKQKCKSKFEQECFEKCWRRAFWVVPLGNCKINLNALRKAGQRDFCFLPNPQEQ